MRVLTSLGNVHRMRVLSARRTLWATSAKKSVGQRPVELRTPYVHHGRSTSCPCRSMPQKSGKGFSMHVLLGLATLFLLRPATADPGAVYCTTGTLGHVHTTGPAGTRGTVTASVCCPASCDRCGGVDCWTQRGGVACCAAHMHERGAPKCEAPDDVGCVLPEPQISEVPESMRDGNCIDLWTAVFPGEMENWQGHSCSYKVRERFSCERRMTSLESGPRASRHGSP